MEVKTVKTRKKTDEWKNVPHTVKILGFRQKKWYKGFYAKNVVPYTYEDDI